MRYFFRPAFGTAGTGRNLDHCYETIRNLNIFGKLEEQPYSDGTYSHLALSLADDAIAVSFPFQ